MESLKNCKLCPRQCGKNRVANETGICGETDAVRLSRAALHFWEEPCVSGDNGSGTVFFAGCPLRCVYCQNREISMGDAGKPISLERLPQIFLELQQQGAHNINLVTPTHFTPQIIKAVQTAKQNGLHVPIVYNTSGYETVHTIQSLQNTVDIYLTDFKYVSPALSARYSCASDYFEKACSALKEMVRQQPKPVLQGDILQKGVIVRHLLLPGCVEDSKKVIKYVYQTYGNQVMLSIMRQFTPYKIPSAYSELNRKVTDAEYDELIDFALSIGIEDAFVQEDSCAEESFIPPFTYEGV